MATEATRTLRIGSLLLLPSATMVGGVCILRISHGRRLGVVCIECPSLDTDELLPDITGVTSTIVTRVIARARTMSGVGQKRRFDLSRNVS